jgi:RNA polymerase sigma factor (sigma-70 family)
MAAGLRAIRMGVRAGAVANRNTGVRASCGAIKGPTLNVAWAELIGSVATRSDRDAFRTLFEHFAPRLKGFLLKKGANAEEAEEIAQNTMIAVWRKAHQFDPNSSGAAAWIFTIARNLQIDAARKATRDDRLVKEVQLESFTDPFELTEPTISNVDTLRVTSAIDQLASEQSEVIRLSYIEGRPHSEIAASLGIPLGTVKSRIRLALKRLRALLD